VEEVIRVVSPPDAYQSVEVGPVVGVCPVFKVRVGEVRVHATGPPRMHRRPRPRQFSGVGFGTKHSSEQVNHRRPVDISTGDRPQAGGEFVGGGGSPVLPGIDERRRLGVRPDKVEDRGVGRGNGVEGKGYACRVSLPPTLSEVRSSRILPLPRIACRAVGTEHPGDPQPQMLL
jgi:hypothetical protein